MYSPNKSEIEENGESHELNTTGPGSLQSTSFSSNVTDDVMGDDAGQQDTKDERASSSFSKRSIEKARTPEGDQHDGRNEVYVMSDGEVGEVVGGCCVGCCVGGCVGCTVGGCIGCCVGSCVGACVSWCSCTLLVCWTLSTVLAIMSIVYGAVYFDHCGIDHRIPVVLIVSGCFQLGHNFTTFGLFGLTAFCSWIASIVIVYLVHANVNLEDPVDVNYCQPMLYNFGTWASIVSLIIGIVLGCAWPRKNF